MKHGISSESAKSGIKRLRVGFVVPQIAEGSKQNRVWAKQVELFEITKRASPGSFSTFTKDIAIDRRLLIVGERP